MISAISSLAQPNSTVDATQTEPAAKAVTSSPKPAVSQAPPAAPVVSDTVQISNAARAIQEAIETPVQTAREARSGDRQAQRLLAREAADKVK